MSVGAGNGRAYYDRKIAEGKTHKEALRSLKRRISNAIYTRLRADTRQAAAASEKGPGGHPGNDSDSSATCGCRKPMPPGDIRESRPQRGRAAGRGSGLGR